MKKNRLVIVILIIALLLISGCKKFESADNPKVLTTSPSPTSAVTVAPTVTVNGANEITTEPSVTVDSQVDSQVYHITTPSAILKSQSYLIKQLFADTMMPNEIYDKFVAAIQGDTGAQEWLDEFDKENNNDYFSVLNDVFPYRDAPKGYLEDECCYNIGILYYYGDEYIPLYKNKEKAYYWLNLSADKGFFYGAIKAGDMVQMGDGVSVNNQAAFDLYEKALEIKKSGEVYERLAYCYENGLGTVTDEQKALEYYYMSTLDGNIVGLYKLLSSDELSQSQTILLSKAVSSLDYSSSYFDMVYGGLGGYNAGDSKLKIVERLSHEWDYGTDPVVVQLKESVCGNQYFPKEFVEALVKTSYTYSYHAFAGEYGIGPNVNDENIKDFQFTSSEFYDPNAGNAYYKLDFDGDGEDEIGVSFYSGAGGAFMADGFYIYKKNLEGVYEEYAYGPDCTLRDAMRLIEYNGRIYFITNPFSDSMDSPHDITAYTIDKNGYGHDMNIMCNEYEAKEIMAKVYDQYYTDEYDDFINELTSQAYEAIDATKKHVMYNPNDTKPVKLTEVLQNDFTVSMPEDVYYAADIYNNGTEKFMRKGHMITQLKYYDDYNLFQIYVNESDLSENAKPMLELLPEYDFYGLHSGGNIYRILPIGGNIVQFWTIEKDNITYCVALTRNELLYALHVYTIQNNKPIAVCNSLYFDEVQSVVCY